MSPLKSGRSRLAIGCAVVAMATAAIGPAWADPVPSYEKLLERIGLTPGALEAEALVDAAEARARQAGVRPNPELSLEAENALGTGPFSGYGNAETTLSVSQDLELWGRRGARVGVAQAEGRTSLLRRDLATLDAAGRLALAYAEAEAADRRFVLAQEALDLTIADARALMILVEEGREPLFRGIQAQSEAERDAAFARLTAVAMLPNPATSIEYSLLDREPPAVVPTSSASPEVRVAEAERDAAESRIEVERVRARPDVRVSVGVRRYEAEDATALTFGLSMPLPLFDRNRGNYDAAQAEFRAADARVMAARQTTQADLAGAEARLRSASSRVWATDAGVTAAEEAYRLSRIGFDAGRISQLELSSSRAALIAARNAAVDARLARVRAEVDLALLQGRAPFGTSL